MKITVKVDGDERDVELPDATVRALETLARRNGLTIDQMLEQAIANEQFIEDKIADGNEILVGRGDRFRKLELA